MPHSQVGPSRAKSGHVVLRPDFTAAQLDYKQLQNTDRQAKARKTWTKTQEAFAKNMGDDSPVKNYNFIERLESGHLESLCS